MNNGWVPAICASGLLLSSAANPPKEFYRVDKEKDNQEAASSQCAIDIRHWTHSKTHSDSGFMLAGWSNASTTTNQVSLQFKQSKNLESNCWLVAC